jgi:hypothetical protein
LRAERSVLAPPTKIGQRIRMGLGLEQLRHNLALQTAESGGRPERLAGGTNGVDRNMRGEIEAGSGHRLKGATVAVRR